MGTKGTLELVPDIKAELKLRLVCAEVPTTLEVEPEALSPPMAMQEVLTLAAWCASLTIAPKLRKASNCSHCALEIGHWFDGTKACFAPLTELQETWRH